MMTGAAAVDSSEFGLGNGGANDACMLAWVYALAPLVTTGGIAPYCDYVDYLLGARRI